jgi:hypothetical protein
MGIKRGYIKMFIKYENGAGYRITTVSGTEYTCNGSCVYTSMGRIIEHDDDIATVEKFCDNYADYILKVARGEV